MAAIWHYDGSSGVRAAPELRAEGGGFRLHGAGCADDLYSWDDLVHLHDRKDGAVYGLKHLKGWQFGFLSAVPSELIDFLPKPQHYGGFIDRFGLGPASAALLALSATIIFVVMKIPDVLAPLVPMSWEKKLGDAMIGDFGGRICHGPGSDAALQALTNRLDPKGPAIDIRIANIAMVNAVALPGGNIVIFRGLLKEAKSPDELAGVLGHEIGHVRNRDVMQSLLRQLGLSVVMGGASSNVSGSLNTLVSSTYSRQAEAEADKHSIKLMREAHISAADTAGFFARLSKEDKTLGKAQAALGYLSSHPLSASREKQFRSSVIQGSPYQPALTPEQWSAIVESCAKDPHVKPEDHLLF
jgi:beta-barrel assembly-enhancing protease